ncbi:uncharacterized protein LOC143037276 [Oratosquilla oratoria]|uniref:uncharacterized protein LOC143037276 n=1 Tax=Oratosquilla oratoria TaxID=337810 RepID=UPI003F76914F
MKAVIKDVASEWRAVPSGVPHGSVLAPVIYLIYVNGMMECTKDYVNMFADDAKITRRVINKGCGILQRDIDTIFALSQEWKINISTEKCKMLKMGNSLEKPTSYYSVGN